VRIYGYEEGQPPDTVPSPPLAKVTLNATPTELRAMAKFLSDCADEMDRMGGRYDHVHLADRLKQFETSPHFVVMRG
jgi:hypothetical protein